MPDTHITVEFKEPDGKKGDLDVTHTWKVPEAVQTELAQVKPPMTGAKLDQWLEERDCHLDDVKGRAASVTKYPDGSAVHDHYKDGDLKTSNWTNLPTAKNDHAGAELLLALMTGGTSLLVPHTFPDDKPAAPAHGSKFAHHPAAAAPADPAAADPGAKASAPPPKAAPPRPQ